MSEASAVSSLAVTIVLVLYRPRLGSLVVGPALAALVGVLLMTASGHLSAVDILGAMTVLWHALVAIASIMIIASAAGHLGVIDRLAAAVVRLGGRSARTLFLSIFCLSAGTAAVLNNDSAILVLTPLVIVLVRRLFPHDPELLPPFAFAVFMAAGVAPLVTANPINLIVSDIAGLDFNDYALRMGPVALVSAALSYLVLYRLFSARLRRAGAVPLERNGDGAAAIGNWGAAERHGLILALGVLGTYPVVAYFGGSVWIVAALGAVAACVLCSVHGVATASELVGRGVAWQILVFLFGVYTLAIGLQNAGAVDWLVSIYSPPNVVTIGVVSAVGSALINNHSMALTNIVAIDALPGADHTIAYLAALIGGDLGPRLLPIGSLAGLLWYATLDRMDVEVPISQFVWVGALITLPSLCGALAMLVLVS